MTLRGNQVGNFGDEPALHGAPRALDLEKIVLGLG